MNQKTKVYTLSLNFADLYTNQLLGFGAMVAICIAATSSHII